MTSWFYHMVIIPELEIHEIPINVFVLWAQASFWSQWFCVRAWVCVCIALVGASISNAVVSVASSVWWRASTRAAAAPHWLPELVLQVKPDSHKPPSLNLSSNLSPFYTVSVRDRKNWQNAVFGVHALLASISVSVLSFWWFVCQLCSLAHIKVILISVWCLV